MGYFINLYSMKEELDILEHRRPAAGPTKEIALRNELRQCETCETSVLTWTGLDGGHKAAH